MPPKCPVPLPTILLLIYWGSTLILKPYYFYHQTSRLSMVYTYFLSKGLTRISLSYYFLTIVWCSSQMGVLYLPIYLSHPPSESSYIICKNLSTCPSAKNVRVQSSIEYSYFDTLPKLTRRRDVFHKYKQYTLIPKDTGNYTSPTVKPITVRGFHKIYFHNYNLLTLITLHTNQGHIPRDWKWSYFIWSLLLILPVQEFVPITGDMGILTESVNFSDVAPRRVSIFHLSPVSPLNRPLKVTMTCDFKIFSLVSSQNFSIPFKAPLRRRVILS